MAIKFSNNASTTLASAILSSDLSLTVTTGDGAEFPTLTGADYFYATIINSVGSNEIVKVTARTGDVFTIVRAQNGTIALPFASGVTIENRMTAGSFNDLVTTVATVEGFPTPADNKFIGEYDSALTAYPAYTAAEMRTALGLEIGSDVEAYDATILKDADIDSTVTGFVTTTEGDILYADASNNTTRLVIGTEDTILTSKSGIPSWEASSAPTLSFPTVETFTSDGTLSIPATVSLIKYYMVAGGGGGGHAVAGVYAGGGGSGAWAEGYLTVTPSADMTVTIGAGGAGGTSIDGGAGGETSLDSEIVLGGGSGGTGHNSSTGNYVGGSGGALTTIGGTRIKAGSACGAGSGGCGGPCPYGVAGNSVRNNSGTSASGYGAGGGGANNATANGGAGAPGIVIIEYYE